MKIMEKEHNENNENEKESREKLKENCKAAECERTKKSDEEENEGKR